MPLGHTCDRRSFRILAIIDEFTRERLAIDVARKLNRDDVLERRAWLMATRGVPDHIRSDTGTEFTSKRLDQWAYLSHVKLAFNRRGKPTNNASIEALNGRLRAECLNENWFLSPADATKKVERWRPTLQ